jgi:hypothetical protein
MSDLRQEIDKIITEGVKKNLDTKIIVDQILSLMTEVRKRENISVQEYENLLRRGKQRIQETRKLLFTSISGSNAS